MILRQTLPQAVFGYWDGGPKRVFEWSIENFEHPATDSKGEFVRIGSWGANHWFHVAKGKTKKQTLCYAMLRLRAASPESKFDYIEEENDVH